jgi:uncharacterized membrane protein
MEEKTKLTDVGIEGMVSVLLRAGVTIAGAVVLGGGVLFLFRHGSEPVNFGKFVGEPPVDRHFGLIIDGAFAGRARSIIQLGILLLIATPIARVVLSIIGFAVERDRAYVIITAIVLGVLLYSLVTGATSG